MTTRTPKAGLRANFGQFCILVGVNALVGGMLGQERTVLPLLATRVFHVRAFQTGLTFILAFGLVKAVTNLAAGHLSDKIGRKPVLVAGWVAGIPVPLLLMWAPSWGWVILANVLLGVNQGLAWSTTVIMKIDLAGPRRRGLAMGLNEFAGYGAVALTALATGYIAAVSGLRPKPFWLGLAFAGLGLSLSGLAVRETRAVGCPGGDTPRPRMREVFKTTTVGEPSLSAACQAGLVNNLNDALAWGLFPLLFSGAGLSISAVGKLAALYPAVWGAAQIFTGAASDVIGRKWMIAFGMWLQGAAIWTVASVHGFARWAAAAAALGLGTAMVYPTLLAVIGDAAPARSRAAAVGVYRFWRDAGFAAGAILVGASADALGVTGAIRLVAVITAVSGGVVALRMQETRPRSAKDPIRGRTWCSKS